MPEGDRTRKGTARQCPTCGQCFEPSIKFCPQDGIRLSEELRTAGEIIAISQTLPAYERPGATSGADAAAPKSGMSQAKAGRPDSDQKGASGNTRTVSADSPRLGKPAEAAEPPYTSGRMQSNSIIGTVLNDQYEIISIIGEGGMSVVYKARHLMMKRTVAVKTLLPHLVLHPLSLERFRQEAQAASNLAHPNIVTIHEFGFTQEGQPYLVMDYLQGTSLSAFIRRDRYLPVDRACHIFVQIADALDHAHKHGVIHRDLKPSNILLVEKGDDPYHVQIVDFGIAKLLPREGHEAVSLTQTGELFGSPLYMSPEQCKGEQLDPKSDVYSMGCLMYESLCGKPPHDGENTLDILYKHINRVPESFNNQGVRVPNKLEMIVFKCLAKSPAQRYQSMEQLHHDLLDLLHERKASILDRFVSAWTLFLLRRKPRSKRDKILVLSETAMLIILLGLSGSVGFLEWRATESPASKQEIQWVEDELPASKPPTSDDTEQMTNLDTGYRLYERHDSSAEQTQSLIERLMKFGNKLVDQDCFDLASDAYLKALKVSRDFNGVRAFETYLAWADYADSLRRKRDANATKEYQALIDEVTKHSGIDEYFFCELYKNLGDSLYVSHRLPQAAKAYETSLRYYHAALADYQQQNGTDRDKDSHFDPSDKAVALYIDLTESRLADCYSSMAVQTDPSTKDFLNSAESLYYECLHHWRQLRGEYSADETVTLYRLARIEERLDRKDRAQGLYKEALEHSKKVFGPNSAYTGLLMRDYANFLWTNGEPLQAIYYRLWCWTVLASAK